MWVKVDFSTEAKKNPRCDMPGQWAIYTKRHWWNKWVERETYADIDWCMATARKLAAYPKIFVN